MANKKLQDLNIDDLIKIAQKPLAKKTKVVSRKLSHLEEIKQFILSEDIKSHPTIQVPALLIFDRYKTWCNLNDIEIRGVNIFFKEFKNHFKMIRVSGVTKYYISSDGFDMSDSYFQKLKNEKKA